MIILPSKVHNAHFEDLSMSLPGMGWHVIVGGSGQ